LVRVSLPAPHGERNAYPTEATCVGSPVQAGETCSGKSIFLILRALLTDYEFPASKSKVLKCMERNIILRGQHTMTETPTENNRKRWREAAVVTGLLLLFLTLSLMSMRQKNVTSDETAHIPAGYTYTTVGDFRLNPEHPPLVKRLSGLMLVFQHANADFNDSAWQNRKQSTFGSKFLFEWNDADKMVFWARLPVVLLSVLLGLGVFFWARELYGWQAGCFALALYLFNPDILAHSQLVTTDLAVSAFLFFSVYTFYRALRHLTIWNALLFGVMVGLTLVTKFSGILIFPILALVAAVFVLSDKMVS